MRTTLSSATFAIYTTMLLCPVPVNAERDTLLDEVTVTGTREAEPRATTAATIDTISAEEIEETHPGHPSEIINRIPGVHVSVTGGEGHMASIRQPITTKPVYLYLEDGIPVRSTGFFNHNALYEINVPQAGCTKVLKGPGTALYGSDAIGAVINVLTRPAPLKPEADIDLETGEHGWRPVRGTGHMPSDISRDGNGGYLWLNREGLHPGLSPPVQVAAAAIDNQPTYSPPSCNSASLNNPKPDYPRIALRRGIEGLVLLHVEVNEQGRPTEIQVKKSAGFKPLDIAALKAVRRWRFLPAQRNGITVRASVEVPIRFRLDETVRSNS